MDKPIFGLLVRHRMGKPVYYGWWMVAASVPIGMYVSGIVSYGFTTFVDPLVHEFGWSYTAVSFAASLRGVETGLLAPVVGMLVDRWGGRRLIFLGGLATSGGLLLLSGTRSIAQFYAAYILMAVGMSCSTSSVLVPAITDWFRTKPGAATGVTVCGFGLSGIMVPLMVTLMASYGWRDAGVILAAGSLALVLPLAFVFRRNPIHSGPMPNAVLPANERVDKCADECRGTPQRDKSYREVLGAVRTKSFWLLFFLFSVHLGTVSAVTAHVMSYLNSIGIARTAGGLIAGAIPLVSIVGRLGLGCLSSRIGLRVLCAATYALLGFGTLLFGLASSFGLPTIIVAVVLLSVGYGGIVTLRSLLIVERFGTRNFGGLFGLLIGMSMMGGVLGPPFAGGMYDALSDYRGAWVTLSLLCTACAGLVLAPRVGLTDKKLN